MHFSKLTAVLCLSATVSAQVAAQEQAVARRSLLDNLLTILTAQEQLLRTALAPASANTNTTVQAGGAARVPAAVAPVPGAAAGRNTTRPATGAARAPAAVAPVAGRNNTRPATGAARAPAAPRPLGTGTARAPAAAANRNNTRPVRPAGTAPAARPLGTGTARAPAVVATPAEQAAAQRAACRRLEANVRLQNLGANKTALALEERKLNTTAQRTKLLAQIDEADKTLAAAQRNGTLVRQERECASLRAGQKLAAQCAEIKRLTVSIADGTAAARGTAAAARAPVATGNARVAGAAARNSTSAVSAGATLKQQQARLAELKSNRTLVADCARLDAQTAAEARLSAPSAGLTPVSGRNATRIRDVLMRRASMSAAPSVVVNGLFAGLLGLMAVMLAL